MSFSFKMPSAHVAAPAAAAGGAAKKTRPTSNAAAAAAPPKREVVPMDVFLVYDASLSDAEFKVAREAGSVLMMMFEDDAQIGFGQYAGEFQLECPLTTDRFEHQTKHTHMKKLKGGNHLALALDGTAKQFQELGRSGTNKVVFLISSGLFDHKDMAIKAAQELRDAKTSIVGVGIGKYDQAALSSVCGDGNVHPESHLQSIMMDLIPTLETKHA